MVIFVQRLVVILILKDQSFKKLKGEINEVKITHFFHQLQTLQFRALV